MAGGLQTGNTEAPAMRGRLIEPSRLINGPAAEKGDACVTGGVAVELAEIEGASWEGERGDDKGGGTPRYGLIKKGNLMDVCPLVVY